MTTIWLIKNDPKGILGESNPLGVILYSDKGVYGLVIAKIIIFIAIAVMALVIEHHWPSNTKVMNASNFSILGLLAWSIVAVTVNVMLIYVISLEKGTYESSFLLRSYIVIFSVTIAGLILLPKFVPSSLGLVEIILALLVVFGPFAISPGLYNFLLHKDMTNLGIYIISNICIVALMVYSINRLYKHTFIARKT